MKFFLLLQTAYNFLQSEVCSALFPAILKDPMKISLIHYIWRANPSLVLRRFLDVYTDPNFLLRILDISEELKVSVIYISPVSKILLTFFCFKLGILTLYLIYLL